MTEPRTPVHDLRDRLEAKRLKAIELLASQDTPPGEIQPTCFGASRIFIPC